ncbi:phage tail protein [Dickeya undicola]|uniref:Phage tail protein n=1 Tax=Dickeya undicola TaxID=1577887 RepID=A0ABX9WWL8_9GAMM|nr:phage tail protein [Dickeya undicola]RNM26460.1 phage tail protein [Dickeya undicola]
MMLALGLFVFHLRTLPYNTIKREAAYNWQGNARIGLRNSHQYLGKGDETITLSGTLIPEISGITSQASRLALDYMADSGMAWPLIEGSGTIYGMFVITRVEYSGKDLYSDGSARSISFTLTLKRIDESLISMFGDLKDQASALYNSEISPALSTAKSTIQGLLS